MAELIRLSIDMFLLRESGSSRQALVKRAKDAVGTFSSGTNNVSTEHDDYLADAYSGR